jgi:hypothetical protein
MTPGCETCGHHHLVGGIWKINECDIADHTPTEAEKRFIGVVGCASHTFEAAQKEWMPITEDDITKILRFVLDADCDSFDEWVTEIRHRSRPLTKELELLTDETGCLCVNCKVEPGQVYCHEVRKMVAEAARAAMLTENKRVLNAVWSGIRSKRNVTREPRSVYLNDINLIIADLRIPPERVK